MSIYGIYNEEEQCLRVGPLKEVIIFLDITPRELSRAMRKDNLIRNKYKICYLFEEQEVQKIAIYKRRY